MSVSLVWISAGDVSLSPSFEHIHLNLLSIQSNENLWFVTYPSESFLSSNIFILLLGQKSEL